MTMATAVFLVLLAFSFWALCHQSVQNYGLKRTLLPCQKQNVKALSNHVRNGRPILGNGESILQTSYHLYLTVPVLWRRKESPIATKKYVTISQSPATLRGFTVRGKSENQSWYSRPRWKGICNSSRVSISVSPTKAKQKHLHGLTSRKGPLVFL